jgi:V/A-type H+-transporting ATPase subunit E
MADFEQRKDKFSIAINHYAEEQRKKIEQEIADYKKKELEETELQVLTECYQLIQKELSQMRIKISHENALREMESRRKLLQRRTEITSEVFTKVTEKLKEFTKQKEYLLFLQKTARQFAKTFGRPGVVIRLKADDQKYEAAIREAFGLDCEFQTDSTIEIGGIKAFHPDMGIFADETIDTLLTDQYGWFETNSGMTVV